MKKINFRDGKIIMRDIIEVDDFTRIEENYLLGLDFNNVPEEILDIFGINPSKKLYRKFFAVRDFYKVFTREKIRYNLYPEALWWLDVLTSPEITLLKIMLRDRPGLARIVSNCLGVSINEEMSDIIDRLSKNMAQQQMGNQSESGGDDQQQGQNLQDDSVIEDLKNKILKKIKNTAEKLNEYLEGAGIGAVFRVGNKSILDVKLPVDVIRKIKSLISVAISHYESLSNTLVTKQYPTRVFDYKLCDDFLFLQAVADGSFYDLERKSKIVCDLYVDTSGSMNSGRGKRIMVAKGIVKELLKRGVRFRKIYRFSDDIKEVNLKELFEAEPDGGTSIEKVLENIKRSNRNSIIVSDFEEMVNSRIKELLQGVKDKITLFHCGNVEYKNKWEKYIKMAFSIIADEI